MQSNIYDAAMWFGGNLVNPVFDTMAFFPDRRYTRMGAAFGQWYLSQGESGEEPPPDMKRAMEIYREIELTADRRKQNELFKEILKLHHKHLWHIGLVGGIPSFKMVANNFHNVAEVSVHGRYSPGDLAPECFAIE